MTTGKALVGSVSLTLNSKAMHRQRSKTSADANRHLYLKALLWCWVANCSLTEVLMGIRLNLVYMDLHHLISIADIYKCILCKH